MRPPGSNSMEYIPDKDSGEGSSGGGISSRGRGEDSRGGRGIGKNISKGEK